MRAASRRLVFQAWQRLARVSLHPELPRPGEVGLAFPEALPVWRPDLERPARRRPADSEFARRPCAQPKAAVTVRWQRREEAQLPPVRLLRVQQLGRAAEWSSRARSGS
jgi:hypothetical protein